MQDSLVWQTDLRQTTLHCR